MACRTPAARRKRRTSSDRQFRGVRALDRWPPSVLECHPGRRLAVLGSAHDGWPRLRDARERVCWYRLRIRLGAGASHLEDERAGPFEGGWAGWHRWAPRAALDRAVPDRRVCINHGTARCRGSGSSGISGVAARRSRDRYSACTDHVGCAPEPKVLDGGRAHGPVSTAG